MIFSNYAKGIVLAVVSAICYGTNPFGAINLYEEGLNVNSVIFYRVLFASIFLMILMYLKNISFKLTLKEFLILVLSGFLFGISALTLFGSFLYMDVGLASTILFVYPIFVALLMYIFFKEKLSFVTFLSILITFLGVTLLYNSDVANVSGFGIFLVVVSSFCYAIYIVIVNKYLKTSALKITFYTIFFTIPVVYLNSFFANNEISLLSTFNMWFFTLFLAIVPTLFSFLFLVKAIQKIGSTNASVLGALEPLTAILIGVVLFNEKVTFLICIGIFLILFGVSLIILQKRILKLFKIKS